MKKVVLRFNKPFTPYKKGDIATFVEQDAKVYLKNKVAEEVQEAKEQKKVSAPKVDKQIKDSEQK